ncbi:ATP-binding protein [Azospirillum sp. ST 5-10]|uniref:sensor histidine kinase n=1 Tax=unclassified Azospirillum TaxID=2630922 RepID=UPI003F4A2CD3
MAVPGLVGAGVSLSLVLFVFLQLQARDATRGLLERAAIQYEQALQERIDNKIFLLTALRGLFARTAMVSDEAFAAAVEPMLPLYTSLTAVGWVLRVTPGDEARLEREARMEGVDGFAVHGPAGAAGDVDPPGGDRFVLFHQQPAYADRSALGLDLGRLPGHAEALRRACAGDRITAAMAGPERLRLFLPVYRASPVPAAAEARCAAVSGYLTAEVAVDRMMAVVVASLPPPRPDVLLLDTTGDGRPMVLAASDPALAAADTVAAAAVVRPLPLGGRRWAVAVPFPPGAPVPGDPAAWGALGIGLLLTALLAVHLHREGRARDMLQAEARARSAMARMLRESEERFRLALRYSHVSVFSQDRELRYVWVYNPQTPLPAERFIGRRHADLFTPADAARLDAIKRRVMDSGLGDRQEVALTVGDRQVVIDLVVEPLHDDDGAVVGVICASIDITESTRIKRALAEAHAEAERANRAKSRFLAAASHDLRQPFQAMSLFHHILMARLTDDGQKEIAGKLGEALAAGNALLTALLDTSALEVGNVTPRVVEFPFRTIAERLATEVSDQAAEKGLRFRMVATAAVIRSDPVLLERVVRNLLVNALRYTRQGGILLGCRVRGGRLRVEVWDTGPGIPDDQMERIFEDFYRGKADRADGGRGLGLGLSIVRRTADILDHPVDVRSRVGRGTVFSVSVPLVDSGRSGGPATPACPAGSVARPASTVAP